MAGGDPVAVRIQFAARQYASVDGGVLRRLPEDDGEIRHIVFHGPDVQVRMVETCGSFRRRRSSSMRTPYA
jgi:hypothetical protein